MEHPLDTVYSGWLGEYSRAMSNVTEPPRSFYYFAALTCLGSMLSGRLTLASEIEPQPRFYTILLGESGDTRKTTAIKKTISFFQNALQDYYPVCHGAGSAEGLCEQFQKNDNLLLVYDEFRVFANKAKIETSVLLQVVNSLFELNYYQSVTKKHSIDIKNAHLSLMGASTVETYSTMFGSQFLDIGFINRLFVVKDHGQKKWSIPPKVDPQENDRLKKHLAELLAVVTQASIGGAVEMKLTADASELWDEFYFEGLPSVPSAKRLDTYGLRLMPLLAINDGKTEVDLETMQKVITTLNYELDVRREVDPLDCENKVAAMEEKIRRYTDGGIKIGDLKQKVHYERYGLWTFNAALHNLQRAEEIKFDPRKKLYFRMDS